MDLDGKALFGLEIEQRLQTRKRPQVKREGTDRESARSCRRQNGRQRTEQRPKGSRDKETLCLCLFFGGPHPDEAQYRIPADNSQEKIRNTSARTRSIKGREPASKTCPLPLEAGLYHGLWRSLTRQAPVVHTDSAHPAI